MDCINRVSSSPQLIAQFEAAQFEFDISVGDSSCQSWVVENFARKISDVRNSVNGALQESECGVALPCAADSQFVCGTSRDTASFE